MLIDLAYLVCIDVCTFLLPRYGLITLFLITLLCLITLMVTEKILDY